MRVSLKATEFNAVVHPGPGNLNVLGVKGEQTAKPGDVILFHGDKATDREVIKKADFEEKYDILDSSNEPTSDPKVKQLGEYSITQVDDQYETRFVVEFGGDATEEQHWFNTQGEAIAYVESQRAPMVIPTDPEPPQPTQEQLDEVADDKKVEEPAV